MKKIIPYKLIIWLIFLFYVSFSPKSQIPKLKLFLIPYFDKIIHFTLYFVLFLLLINYVNKIINKAEKKAIIISFFICFFLGILTEIGQHYFPINRTADIYDLLINTIGIIIAIIFFILIKKNNRLLHIFKQIM